MGKKRGKEDARNEERQEMRVLEQCLRQSPWERARNSGTWREKLFNTH